MSARYLIRLDDACATMNRRKWTQIEEVLDRHAIKPIVAVVPDNQDPTLIAESPDPAFWSKVRAWQAKGWTVAMHGHTHAMRPINCKLLLPYYRRSEFAGRSAEVQAEKIRTSWRLFVAQDILPKVWVAPAHSFDRHTLEAIRAETPIRLVSDGIAWNTYYEHGFHWIPQQMWWPAKRRSGLWTVNLHPGKMSENEIVALDKALAESFRECMISLDDVKLVARRKSFVDRLYHEYFWWKWRKATGNNPGM